MPARWIFCCLGALGVSGSALAQVVTFTSFQGGYGFDTVAQGIAIQGPSDPNPVIGGFQFTAGVTGSLANVTVPLRYVFGSTGVFLNLYADASDHIGSGLIGWSVPSSSDYHLATVANSDPSIVLNAGSKYWLVMSTSGNGVHHWGRSGVGGLMMSAYQFNNDGIYHYGNTDVFPAYEVQVNAVPEPGTLLAVATGIALLRRRRSRAS
jgi:hypothetical protein